MNFATEPAWHYMFDDEIGLGDDNRLYGWRQSNACSAKR